MKPRHRALLRNNFIRAFYVFCVCASSSCIYAQSDIINSPLLITSSGGTLIQEDYNLCFSIGELAIVTLLQPETILTQGFHQDNYQILAINEVNNDYDIDIYPNPTNETLNVNCNLKKKVNLNIKDIKGNTLLSILDKWGDQTHSIDLNYLPQGVYFLEVLLNGKENKVYQIQKFN